MIDIKKVSYNKYRRTIHNYYRDLIINNIIFVICIVGTYIGYTGGKDFMAFGFFLFGFVTLIFDFYLIYFMYDYMRNYRPKNRIRDFDNITISELNVPEPTKRDKR